MFASPSSAIRRSASVEVIGCVVLKFTVSFFFMARGGLGSCEEDYPAKNDPEPTVWVCEKPAVMLGLVPGATDFLIGNFIDLIGKSFFDP